MKKIGKLIIGGIESKVFNLILYTVFLITAAFTGIYVYHTNMLMDLAEDSAVQQREGIDRDTKSVTEGMITKTLANSNGTEALIADGMFDAVRDRVAFLGGYAEQLFAHPEDYEPKAYAGPDAADDGTWTMKVIYADGVDPADPKVVSAASLAANLSGVMISLCPSFGMETIYVGLPEGVHLTVSKISSGWLENGKVRSYDPRERNWYKLAAETGKLVFTDGEADALTGEYCIECAMPVYDPAGELRAVVGADLFLSEMQSVLGSASLDGESVLLLNDNGHAVLAPQAKLFPMSEADREADLRNSENALLAGVAATALKGGVTGVKQGDLEGGAYYIAGTPLRTPGWALISAYSKAVLDQPSTLLRNSFSKTQAQAVATYRDKTGKARRSAAILLFFVIALALIGAMVLGKRIVRPLNRITARIAELRGEDLEFKMEPAFRTGDEIEQLALSFADLSHKTVQYVEEVKSVTAEKERIGAELSMATDIQASQLPRLFPAFPNRPEFDLYASMTPAREVGGDFYDFFLVDDDHIAMVMADVSGKGVPAALFMMVSRVLIKSHLQSGKSPGVTLEEVSNQLCESNEAQFFVTVWLAVLEISTGKGVAVNAGHEHPALRHGNGAYELVLYHHSPAVAVMEGIRYKEHSFEMEPGDSLFVYTDGVAEATNAENELFGTDRMLTALNREPGASVEKTLGNVMEAINTFVAGAEQFDDITMLCMKYNGPTEKK